jgi:xylulokinase
MAGEHKREEHLFLGLDCSTQALKASLLSGNLSVLSEIEIRFDNDLSHFATSGGTLQGSPGSGIVYSPVKIVIEAIDLLFTRIQKAKWPIHNVRGVSAAGQQHASVYWSAKASGLLSDLKSDLPLSAQLNGAFSRDEIPNWQDSSTLAECQLLEERMGGASNLAQVTGSRAHTRFTGPQIMRFMKSQPEAYENTARISLVSSLMTTMLCLDGEIKSIDESDACGMNLYDMNSAQRGWSKEALEAVAGKDGSKALAEKLGVVEADGGRIVGLIGKWYVERYGFSSECIVCPGTGDNPATFLAFALQEQEGLISLGTSDTVLVSTSTYKPDPEYHSFIHPAASSSDSTTRYFNMLVYKNGSLAREAIRDQYFESSWDNFNQAVESARPKGQDDILTQTGFWWLKPEIIPANASGVHKYSTTSQRHTADVAEYQNPSLNAVAILESQMLSYRSRANAILGDDNSKLKRIFAVGGAASNLTICSVMADVMGCNVCKQTAFDEKEGRWKDAGWNACSVAAAYKAAWSWTRHIAENKAGKSISFDSFVDKCKDARKRERQAAEVSSMSQEEDGIAVVARPDSMRAKVYDNSVDWWKELEANALQASRSKHSNNVS